MWPCLLRVMSYTVVRVSSNLTLSINECYFDASSSSWNDRIIRNPIRFEAQNKRRFAPNCWGNLALKAHGLWIFAVNRTDSWILKLKHSGSWISCEFWRRFRIVPVLMFESWVLNEIWIIDLSSALVGMLMSSSKFFFSNEAHLNSGVRLLLELYCVIVIKYVAFFTICAKLTMPFTFTSLPLNFCTSVSGCGCGFGYEQIYWRFDGFGEKKAWIGGFAYPYSPPSSLLCSLPLWWNIIWNN